MRNGVPALGCSALHMNPRRHLDAQSALLARIAGALTSLPVLLAMACAAAVIGCR
jgi:hypothetical protein